jgi:hypothetical protein
VNEQVFVHFTGAYGKRFFRCTDQFREPKKGEWYLSGGIIEAWEAPCDLSTKYWIAEEIQQPPPEFVMLHGMRYRRDDGYHHERINRKHGRTA